MSDISILWNTTRGDWQRAGGALASGNDIVTSVLISIFTDRVATPDDTVPDATRRLRDPRGWWADQSIGSRLWLLDRAKRTQETLQRAQSYIVEALQWLVDDNVASRVEVSVEWTRQNTLGAQVVVYSPRTGKPLVKVGTQNVFRLPDAQAWGWNSEHGAGQWFELVSARAFTVDVDLDGIINCGLVPTVGKRMDATDPGRTYVITLPAGRLYKAFSSHLSENIWSTDFRVTNAEGVTVHLGNSFNYSSADQAFANWPGASVTGSTAYTFWLQDAGTTSDNGGGLSFTVTAQ